MVQRNTAISDPAKWSIGITCPIIPCLSYRIPLMPSARHAPYLAQLSGCLIAAHSSPQSTLSMSLYCYLVRTSIMALEQSEGGALFHGGLQVFDASSACAAGRNSLGDAPVKAPVESQVVPGSCHEARAHARPPGLLDCRQRPLYRRQHPLHRLLVRPCPDLQQDIHKRRQ
jgi:hypothetical protein